MNLRPIDEELSVIAQTLWDLDQNRAKWNEDFEVNLQKSVLGNHTVDRCDDPLLTHVNEDRLFQVPTYSSFIALLDNYISNTGHKEVITKKELFEESKFLDSCLSTELMQAAWNFLADKNLVSRDKQEFKKQLAKIWFKLYTRSVRDKDEDSCGFEHVFIGEENDKGAIGCHNWINFYLKEKYGLMNYFGYMPKKCQSCDDTGNPDLITIQYSQNGFVKSIGGFLMGVSPEFELALYTIIFLCAEKQVTKLHFANMDVYFNCFKMQRNGKNVLATVYPSTK